MDKWKTLWQKEKLLVLSNFFFCHYVFKKPSAAEALESVYMRGKGSLLDMAMQTFLCQGISLVSSYISYMLGTRWHRLSETCLLSTQDLWY